jgi:hypothetical protein
MAVAVLTLKPKLKTFHAAMLEWCVDAETPEQARELLASGQGHRCQLGDCLNIEVERVEE